MTAYNWQLAVAQAPMTVFCDPEEGGCGAGRGSRCRTSGGWQNRAVPFHKPRRAAVAHLSEQQRYDAFAAMKAEERALRAQVSARLARPLTPAQVASRRATGEAWARTDVEVREWRRTCANVLNHTFGCRCKTEQPARPPLSPIRGVVVDFTAAKRRKALRVVPSGGGVA